MVKLFNKLHKGIPGPNARLSLIIYFKGFKEFKVICIKYVCVLRLTKGLVSRNDCYKKWKHMSIR